MGKLPDASLVTQRFTQEEVDEFIKGPLNGGKHLYTSRLASKIAKGK